jgi:hypothetical protein
MKFRANWSIPQDKWLPLLKKWIRNGRMLATV